MELCGYCGSGSTQQCRSCLGLWDVLCARGAAEAEQAVEEAGRFYTKTSPLRVRVTVTLSPILEALRVIVRNVHQSSEASSTLSDMARRVVQQRCVSPRIEFVDHMPSSSEEADVVLLIEATLPIEEEERLVQSLFPEHATGRIKSLRKRKRADDTSSGLLSSAEADSLVRFSRDASAQDKATLQAALQSSTPPPLTVTLSATPATIYLFGRYRKLARDVPQSPWTVSSPSSSSSSSSFSSSSSSSSGGPQEDQEQEQEQDQEQELEQGQGQQQGQVRKGRQSVEEIISEAAQLHLGSAPCRLHACGREDIDVRCLGNGRPFCLLVPAPLHPATEGLLAAIENSINTKQGRNQRGDVLISHLSRASRAMWEGMQAAAEEKKKGYSCVVWSSRPLDKLALSAFEAQCRGKGVVGDQGEQVGLELSQATPLRVLHRRSLLRRTRHVMRVRTYLLSPHLFLMRLVTAAGTYVKEFVHGDLGRTTPSVSSLLGASCNILQLDVEALYDEFPGGWGASSEAEVATKEAEAEAEAELGQGQGQGQEQGQGQGQKGPRARITWADLKALRLPSYRATSAMQTADTIGPQP